MCMEIHILNINVPYVYGDPHVEYADGVEAVGAGRHQEGHQAVHAAGNLVRGLSGH